MSNDKLTTAEWIRRLNEETSTKTRDMYPRQLELIPREVDREKVEKHIGKAERELRDQRILKFIGIWHE